MREARSGWDLARCYIRTDRTTDPTYNDGVRLVDANVPAMTTDVHILPFTRFAIPRTIQPVRYTTTL